MKCEKAELLLMDSLMGDLSSDDRQELAEHLAGCSRCSAEAAAMESTWRELGEADQLRSSSNSARMIGRFQRSLKEFEADLDVSSRPTFSEWWMNLWATRPVWQIGFSAAVLGCGVLLGLAVSSKQTGRIEIDELRANLESVNRAVTVLLQHESATERLRAVNWSMTEEPSDVVLDALLQSVRLDSNVNVRLAAVDALAEYADRGPIRSGLIDSLAVERSPLVQLAVVEVVAAGQGFSGGELEQILRSSDLDPSVLAHFSVQTESL
jgi:anti-sigma factor RsiW